MDGATFTSSQILFIFHCVCGGEGWEREMCPQRKWIRHGAISAAISLETYVHNSDPYLRLFPLGRLVWWEQGRGRRRTYLKIKPRLKKSNMNYTSTTIPYLTILKRHKQLQCWWLKVTQRLCVEINKWSRIGGGEQGWEKSTAEKEKSNIRMPAEVGQSNLIGDVLKKKLFLNNNLKDRKF